MTKWDSFQEWKVVQHSSPVDLTHHTKKLEERNPHTQKDPERAFDVIPHSLVIIILAKEQKAPQLDRGQLLTANIVLSGRRLNTVLKSRTRQTSLPQTGRKFLRNVKGFLKTQ